MVLRADCQEMERGNCRVQQGGKSEGWEVAGSLSG